MGERVNNFTQDGTGEPPVCLLGKVITNHIMKPRHYSVLALYEGMMLLVRHLSTQPNSVRIRKLFLPSNPIKIAMETRVPFSAS